MKNELQGECIKWHMCILPNGYGQAVHKGKRQYAHRLAYCAANGLDIEEIKGVLIRHRCDNPSCVNPNHLETGTNRDNSKDAVVRDRIAFGSRQHLAKLSDEQVRQIRQEYERGSRDKNTYTLAEKYGVNQRTVSRVVRGETWERVA
jgi:hypothetical protein